MGGGCKLHPSGVDWFGDGLHGDTALRDIHTRSNPVFSHTLVNLRGSRGPIVCEIAIGKPTTRNATSHEVVDCIHDDDLDESLQGADT
jgi:hypothetical protein